MAESLLIVGASVRAAAFSALRAGYVPLAIDIFCDCDLVRRVPAAARALPFPAELPAAARRMPAAPLMYTGACENYPQIVDILQRERCLYGNRAEVLRRVRDPIDVARTLATTCPGVPRVQRDAVGLPCDGSWLRKPLASGAGHGIQPWTPATLGTKAGERVYFQQRIDGIPCSAVFVAAEGGAVLLAATRQLVGEGWTGAGGFGYAGSIGPLPLDAGRRGLWQRIGQVLAAEYRLVGLFGVDAIADGDRVWPVEVNPRYPASTEIVERALGIHAVGHHVAACRDGKLPPVPVAGGSRSYGKAILYARHDMIVPAQLVELADAWNDSAEWPTIADIPAAGTPIGKHRPILTVLAEAPDAQGVEARLRDLAAELYDLFRCPAMETP